MNNRSQDSPPPSPKGQIPRNPWRDLSDVRDAPNMRRRRIERRYSSLGVEIAAVDRVPRLTCFAMHAFPPAATVIHVHNDPPGTEWPIPLCDYHAEVYPLGVREAMIGAAEWEGPLGPRVRIDPPEQMVLDA